MVVSKVRLNAQGMSRSNKTLMSTIISDPGFTFVSCDLSAGEPTVTSHYSGDERYTYANFTGVGKKPFYKDKILYIDDMYFMIASVSPTGREDMLEAFNTTYKGVSFAEQWMIDKEYLQKVELGFIRKPHKTLALAKQYGQGPRGSVIFASDNGLKLSMKDAKAFDKAFWYTLFPDVRKLGERLKLYVKKNGYIVNQFGYRCFSVQRKALNSFIQSSVSGIIDVLMIKFYTICSYARHHAIIHDEIIFSVPDNKLVEAKELWNQAVKSLNDDLKWSVKIRTGWVAGKDFFESH